MRISRATVLALVTLAALAPAASGQKRGKTGERALTLPRSELSERDAIVHVLDRLAFGPRAGDVGRIQAAGLARWLDEQLHPEGKPDPDVEARLKPFASLTLSAWELLSRYPDAALQKQIAERQKDMAAPAPPFDKAGPQRIVEELVAAKLVRETYSRWQLNEVLVDFWLNHFNVFIQKGPMRYLLTEYERDVIRPHAWGKFKDLLAAVAQSPAMLVYLDNFESTDASPPRQMFQPRHPFDPAAVIALPRPPTRQRGLNENYARELLELHTLGVDGGYTQKDVTEVARCFTGWTIVPPQQGGGSIFVEAAHDHGEKVVLGRRIPAGRGIEDGLDVLAIVAEHPATARFVATKLARHLVADTPPPALVDRVARVYAETAGDIREMVRAIVTSPEFFSARYAGAKFKRPLEFFVSAVRALDADLRIHPSLFGILQALGEPPFGCLPPTGYSDAASEWLSTTQLLRRMNTALQLASGRVPGAPVDLERVLDGIYLDDAPALIDGAAERLLGRRLPEDQRTEMIERLRAAQRNPAELRALAAALVLGSPEFQRQ
jgi:uncharacterized protein (DUF1800 family)